MNTPPDAPPWQRAPLDHRVCFQGFGTYIENTPVGQSSQNGGSDDTELRISIIIPTYNKATHLARLLPSILVQTVSPQNYEVIIVDDGSTDETPSVVEPFKDLFPHFLYVRQENKGIGGARNAGLKHAR